MARRHYLVEGGQLECTLGTAPGEMVVTSQQKLTIKQKLKATSEDKAFKPPFFGSCKCSSPNPPCSPVLKEWQLTSKKSRMGDKTFVMKNSQIQCSKGGMITVKDVGQTLVGTGKEEPELDKKYAKLQGEIIFANGYLSSSLGGILNALFDINPDKKAFRGLNVNEEDKLDGNDILLSKQIEGFDNMTQEQIEADKKSKDITLYYPTVEFEEVQFEFPIGISPMIPKLHPIKLKVPKIKEGEFSIDIPKELKPIPLLTKEELKDTFWGYWNDIRNDSEGSNTYAHHFNAGRNQHFLNGSHGLASNAAHRIDHGIAQGYHWAKFQWGIIPKEEVDDTNEKIPYIKSYSPAYKPLTIVMHSQGNAPGVGFALGAMKYANELGWEQVPLNLIFLGVHQPQNLWEEEYEKFINAKVNYYGVDKNFWHGVPWSPLLKQDKNVAKFANALSDLFNPDEHKLRHKRGIYEHLQAITSFDALQERAVQFTFSNDRGDLVIRDGDIPNIDSACNPKRDTTLYSVEFFRNKAPEGYTSKQGKEIVTIKNGGQLVIPAYAAVPRIEVEKDKLTGEEKLVTWKDYKSIAIDWADAFSNYKQLLQKYKLTWKDFLFPTSSYIKSKVKGLKLTLWHKAMLYHYGRIQHADLYAHFSPVGLINNDKILKHKDFNDSLGNENIWARIKKAGEQKFYRMEYSITPDKIKLMTDEEKEAWKEQKRIEEDNYVNKGGKKLLIKTSITDTDYINNVIKAYVKKDLEAEKQLYHEHTYSDKELTRLQKMFGLNGKEMEDKQKKHQDGLLKKMQIRQDNAKVAKPKKPILKNN